MNTRRSIALVLALVVAAPHALDAGECDTTRCAFTVPDIELDVGATGAEIPILVTNEAIVVYALQVGVAYDKSVISVTEVIRTGTTVENADFFHGAIDAETGTLAYGVLFDLGGDFSELFLPAGADQLLLKLVVDVTATTAAQTDVSFAPVQIDVVSENPIRNILTNSAGFTEFPLLESGTVTITLPDPDAPSIVSVEGNSGAPGTVFQVVADNVEAPGLAVFLDGVEAGATLRADGRTIDVTAPPTDRFGECVELRVSNENGQDTRAEGFCYDPIVVGGTFVRGDANDDTKVDISDGIFTLTFLFNGGPDTRCPDSMDSNDTGDRDLTDAVYVFNFLFQGGPAPLAPFPLAGLDESVDELPECSS